MPNEEQDLHAHEISPIDSISVEGFKSLASPQTVRIRPLTLLAGTNSSGKSSLMQAVLLLKQTLEAPFDPGPLLLDGQNVRFTSSDQILTKQASGKAASEFRIAFGTADSVCVELRFERGNDGRLAIAECRLISEGGTPTVLRPGLGEERLLPLFPSVIVELWQQLKLKVSARVQQDRCFLRAVIEGSDGQLLASTGPEEVLGQQLQDLIHLPGWRGNPERTYPRTGTGPEYPGTFEKYTATVVAQWSEKRHSALDQLAKDLKTLGLTWKVVARSVDETRVELQVGRLPTARQGGGKDLVNIADVGFGVSQTLPILVALLVAKTNQLVYVEQPEIHLHPRAQVAMAQVLVNAANRGVRVVVETHSSLLLLGIQRLVADGVIPHKDVLLHWFRRDPDGSTEISAGMLDEAGRFGDWPADFDEVALETQMSFLNASEKRLVHQ